MWTPPSCHKLVCVCVDCWSLRPLFQFDLEKKSSPPSLLSTTYLAPLIYRGQVTEYDFLEHRQWPSRSIISASVSWTFQLPEPSSMPSSIINYPVCGIQSRQNKLMGARTQEVTWERWQNSGKPEGSLQQKEKYLWSLCSLMGGKRQLHSIAQARQGNMEQK